ncbi:hypothetical protein [Blastomonas sp. UPD001]|jgi:hypothetical protein|uniref:hypothetical protein n=1 Tax=Blastomonas sp. UPD001 TaxID=2217673 RepID=UPI000E344234|nr:hypothetical protein [Blastomonas sp. UPD001]
MKNGLIPIARKSLHAHAFEHYLRTGRRIDLQPRRAAIERKFNPYHDPDNGQFTFAPGGRRSGTSPRSSQRGSDAPKPGVSANPAKLLLAQYRPNRRARIGGNRGPALNDPMTLERAFPGLRNAPGSSIIALADNALDITGPSRRLTTELADAEVKKLIAQIKQVDPDFRYQSLGPATTLEGQINEIQGLRMHRAAVRYNKLGDMGPLQVEVLRRMQISVDRAYDNAIKLYESGHLRASLSRSEAIGNYIDRSVKAEMKRLFARHGIEHGADKQVRVAGREYDTSRSVRTYRIPDVRVGKMAYDMTTERKLPSKPQIRGFFGADFGTDSAVIVRPTQLGRGNTYAIKKPGK